MRPDAGSPTELTERLVEVAMRQAVVFERTLHQNTCRIPVVTPTMFFCPGACG